MPLSRNELKAHKISAVPDTELPLSTNRKTIRRRASAFQLKKFTDVPGATEPALTHLAHRRIIESSEFTADKSYRVPNRPATGGSGCRRGRHRPAARYRRNKAALPASPPSLNNREIDGACRGKNAREPRMRNCANANTARESAGIMSHKSGEK